VGAVVASAALVNGKPLQLSVKLPRCACFLRANKSKAPAAVTTLLNSSTLRVPQGIEQSVVREAQPGPPLPKPPDIRQPGTGKGRPVNTVEQLQESRELRIYHASCSDEALLGSIMVTSEHKIADVVRMLREELDVHATGLCRGAYGSELQVPIHKGQHYKPALTVFTSKEHHVVVLDVADDA